MVASNHDQLSDYGPRLSQAEYERRIIALHVRNPALSTRVHQEQLRSAEMALLIDYKLGMDFPADRRAAILSAHRRMTRRFVWRLLCSVLTHPFQPSDGLARVQVRSFSRLLDDDDTARLLDISVEDVTRLRGW